MVKGKPRTVRVKRDADHPRWVDLNYFVKDKVVLEVLADLRFEPRVRGQCLSFFLRSDIQTLSVRAQVQNSERR